MTLFGGHSSGTAGACSHISVLMMSDPFTPEHPSDIVGAIVEEE
jgi:hypothetical protein